MKIFFVLINALFKIDVDIMQLTYKFDIKFKTYKFIISIDDVEHNLRIFVMLFNELTINIIKTLTNNHISFKFNNVNKKLKIIQHQSIVNIFALFNIFNNEF